MRDQMRRLALLARQRFDEARLVVEQVRAFSGLGVGFTPTGQVGDDEPELHPVERCGGAPPGRRGRERAVDQDDRSSGPGGPVCEAPALDEELLYSSFSCLCERSRTSVFMPTSLRFFFSSSLPVSK